MTEAYDWGGVYDVCPHCGFDRGELSSIFGPRYSAPPFAPAEVMWWCWKCDPRPFYDKVQDTDNYPTVDYEPATHSYIIDGVRVSAERMRDG